MPWVIVAWLGIAILLAPMFSAVVIHLMKKDFGSFFDTGNLLQAIFLGAIVAVGWFIFVPLGLIGLWSWWVLRKLKVIQQ